jgi:hypothetical protein
MKKSISIVWVAAFLMSLSIAGCKNRQTEETSSTLESSQSEHTHDVHEEGEGEESGKMMAIDEVYDEVRKGTHLVLVFDIEASEFAGTVENVSDQILDRVKVEVHLSNGTVLGPTTQVDLKPGEIREINLNAGENSFQTWSTHAEVGSGEHSHEGEHEHGPEGEHSHEHN